MNNVEKEYDMIVCVIGILAMVGILVWISWMEKTQDARQAAAREAGAAEAEAEIARAGGDAAWVDAEIAKEAK